VALYICFIGNIFRVKLCRNSEEPPLYLLLLLTKIQSKIQTKIQ